MHAEQAYEQAEQEAGYATGDQYPRVPRLLRLDLQPQDFRAPFVQFHRSVRELLPRALPLRPLLAAIVHRPRDDFTRVQPRVERVALAAARVELDRILGQIEFLQGAERGQILRRNGTDVVLGDVQIGEGWYRAQRRYPTQSVLRQLKQN